MPHPRGMLQLDMAMEHVRSMIDVSNHMISYVNAQQFTVVLFDHSLGGSKTKHKGRWKYYGPRKLFHLPSGNVKIDQNSY